MAALTITAGARYVLTAAAAGHGADALAIGLVCGVVFGEEEPRAELRDAAVRMEKLVGGVRVDPQGYQVGSPLPVPLIQRRQLV